jgi:hypothetical protein
LLQKKDGSEVTSRPKARPAASSGILPPPPGGVKVAPPPKLAHPTSSPIHKVAETGGSNVDLLMGVGAPPPATSPAENWGEFASAAGQQAR